MRLTRFSPTPPARCRAGPLLLGRAPAAGCRPNWRRHHPLLHRRSPCAHRNLASAPVPPRLPTAPPSPNARRLRERAGFGNGGRVSLPAAAAGRERPLSTTLGGAKTPDWCRTPVGVSATIGIFASVAD